MKASVKDLVGPVPQPYKTYLARALLIPAIIVFVPYAVIAEGILWLKQEASAIAGAWRDIKDW